MRLSAAIGAAVAIGLVVLAVTLLRRESLAGSDDGSDAAPGDDVVDSTLEPSPVDG
jgi:hypothetical protein